MFHIIFDSKTYDLIYNQLGLLRKDLRHGHLRQINSSTYASVKKATDKEMVSIAVTGAGYITQKNNATKERDNEKKFVFISPVCGAADIVYYVPAADSGNSGETTAPDCRRRKTAKPSPSRRMNSQNPGRLGGRTFTV